MQNKIIGRIEEQRELKDTFDSKKSELVAVYGRRRVGKTYLIRNYFKQKKCIYFQVLGLQKGSLEEQLQNFTDSLSETFYDGMPLQSAPTWKEAFKRLTLAIEKHAIKNKVILFFDELPWMSTPRSGLLQALDYFWNKHWVDIKNLKLFICGSSASWILKKIINNRGGLHNRVTRQILVRPFLLNETKAYLHAMGCKFNQTQILELYIAIGGIPFYLNGIKPSLSANQNINNLCFRNEGILFDEFEKLFKSLFHEADAYLELMRLIALKRYGISRTELESKCKLTQKGGTLTERLKGLEEAGFILSIVPMNHKTRGIYYKVIDEFSLFYLTWVEPEKSSLMKIEKQSTFWKRQANTPAWYTWSGYAFEAVCYKHISIIRKAFDIPEGSRAIVWKYSPGKGSTEQGAQIDLLFDRNDGVITLCEIKYSTHVFVIDKDCAKNLINKKEVFIRKTNTLKQIFMVMIAANGVKDNLYADDLLSRVITLDDLYDK